MMVRCPIFVAVLRMPDLERDSETSSETGYRVMS